MFNQPFYRTIKTSAITMLIAITLFSLSQHSLKPQPAYATGPLCVRPTGNDGSSCACSDTLQYCRSVQRAINMAATGDTIRVAEGNYGQVAGATTIGTNGLIDLSGTNAKSLNLEGGWDTNFTARKTATTKGAQL